MSIDPKKIVVNHALMHCNCTPDTPVDFTNYRRLELNCQEHGYNANGMDDLIAHEFDCIPQVNLERFSCCKAEHYKEALYNYWDELQRQAAVNLTPALLDELARCKKMLNALINPYTIRTCFLDVIEQWFHWETGVGEDDSCQMYFGYINDILNISEKYKEMAKYVKGAKAKVDSYYKDCIKKEKDKEKKKEYKDKKKEFDKQADDFLSVIKYDLSFYPIDDVGSTRMFINDTIFAYRKIVKLFQEFKDPSGDDCLHGDTVRQYFREYPVKNASNNLIISFTHYADFLEMIRDGPEVKQKVLTTDAFLACRFGGIITFKSSGQEICVTAESISKKV